MRIIGIERMGVDDKSRPVQKWGNRPVEAVVGHNRCRFRSEFEWRWATWLQRLLEAGAINDWQYEPHRFEFRDEVLGAKVYTPDFLVVEGGERSWHECKGRLVGSDVTKYRRMAEYYPKERLVLVMMRVPRRGATARRLSRAGKYVAEIVDGGKELKRAGL